VTGTDEMNNDYLPEPPLAVFTIEIAAPGGSSTDWRLSASQELPLAECARQIVERFDFKAEVIELKGDRDIDTSRPGIILIDPRFMTLEGGRAALEGAVAGLPRWVLPLLILDPSDDVRADELAEQARDVLSAAGAPGGRSARRGARGVSSPQAFSLLVRDLVLEAEVQYIRHRSRQRYGAPVPSRPSSNRFSPPLSSWPDDRFAFEPDPLGETPDAR
jgi:hypothetical protein